MKFIQHDQKILIYIVKTSNHVIVCNGRRAPHVHDLLRPDQPLYLIDTGASALILGIDMFSDKEKRSMQDPADDSVQVLAMNRDDIKVYGRIQQTVHIDDKLHRHVFLVTALP